MADAPLRRYRFEAFRLDTHARELRDGDGVAIPLTAKAFDTLCFLIEHRHRIVGKDELLDNVWAGRVVEENNLTQAVSALRRALGSGAGDHRYVVTVPGRGYQFVADVHEGAPELVAQATPAIVGDAATPTLARSLAAHRMIAIGALVFVLGLFAAVAWQMREATPAPTPVQSSLAVLAVPLAEPRTARQTAGARTRRHADHADQQLRHVARALADFQPALHRGEAGPARRGSPARCDYVVDGTIQRSGDRVRVSTRLADVRDDRRLWSGTFDENIDRVFTLQDSIAAAMTTALELKLVRCRRVAAVPATAPMPTPIAPT